MYIKCKEESQNATNDFIISQALKNDETQILSVLDRIKNNKAKALV